MINDGMFFMEGTGMKEAKKEDNNFKKRVFDIIQIGTHVDIPSCVFDFFISVMIIMSVTVTFLHTFEELNGYSRLFAAVEFLTTVIFIIEYLLRVWTATFLYPEVKWHVAVRKFVLSFYGIVELMTILSYFAPIYSNGMIALRIIRVMRIMRLFRINSKFDAFNIVAGVIVERKRQILSSVSMIAMLMLAASFCMYGFEHEAQPDVYKNAFSGIWWAMSTVLTVGYGDIYPITVGGQIVAIIIALLGVCVVAIPTGVISAGFVEYYAQIRNDVNSKLNDYALSMLEREAKRNNMSANEYMLYLMYKERDEEPDRKRVDASDGN